MIHNDGKIGFVDPATDEYTTLFLRDFDGRIIPALGEKEELAKHIIDELKLWLPIHQRMWKFEKLTLLKNKIKHALTQLPDGDIKEKVKEFHYAILVILDGIHVEILDENE